MLERKWWHCLIKTNGMDFVDQAYGEIGLIGHFEDGNHIALNDLNLEGINKVNVRAGSMGSQPS